MTIDHIGIMFYPEMIGLRVLGRLALPVFCLGVALGIRVTRDIKKYYLRLLVVAVVSEIPHFLAFGGMYPNICFQLLGALVMIQAARQRQYLVVVISPVLAFLMLGITGLYIYAMVAVFYYLRASRIISMCVLTLSTILMCVLTGEYLQLAAIVYYPLILWVPEARERLPIPRKLFYVYYPAHLFVLFLVSLFVR